MHQATWLRQTHGEITMLDFPQFTRDVFASVRHMDLWSSLFGDVNDDSMHMSTRLGRGTGVEGAQRLMKEVLAAL